MLVFFTIPINQLINSKCSRRIYFFFAHSYINYVNIAWASTNKTKLVNLKNYLENKNKLRVLFAHALPLLKTLNAINVYQRNF